MRQVQIKDIGTYQYFTSTNGTFLWLMLDKRVAVSITDRSIKSTFPDSLSVRTFESHQELLDKLTLEREKLMATKTTEEKVKAGTEYNHEETRKVEREQEQQYYDVVSHVLGDMLHSASPLPTALVRRVIKEMKAEESAARKAKIVNFLKKAGKLLAKTAAWLSVATVGAHHEQIIQLVMSLF